MVESTLNQCYFDANSMSIRCQIDDIGGVELHAGRRPGAGRLMDGEVCSGGVSACLPVGGLCKGIGLIWKGAYIHSFR